MTNIITTIGWFGFLLGLAYFVVYDHWISGSPDADYVTNTVRIWIASGALVLFGYALKFLAGVVGVGSGKCKKCGKRIDKGEMFCFDHRREQIWEAREKEHAASKRK